MNKLFKLLLLNEDGQISTSRLSAFIGVLMLMHIYWQVFILGVEYTETKAFMAELLLGIAFGLRGVDRFSRYGLTGVIGAKEKKAAAKAALNETNETPQPAPVAPAASNFTLVEFASPDGAPFTPQAKENLNKLIQNLEVIRAAAGNKPLTISSGYRSAAHNAAVGGKPKSQHLYGNAADIKIKGMRPAAVARLIKQLMEAGKIEAGGLKAYKTFVHYDRRGEYVTW